MIDKNESGHQGPQIAMIKGYTNVAFGYLHSMATGNALYTREGNTMEIVLIRGFLAGILSITIAIAFLSTLYGSKYLKSSTFAIIARTKVYITLLMDSLFAKDNVQVSLIIFSVISFVGITLVIDASIFGLEEEPEETPNTTAAILYFEQQMYGILSCFVYVIANAFSKGLETYVGTLEKLI